MVELNIQKTEIMANAFFVAAILANGKYSDVTVECGTTKFPCHRSVLSRHSKVMKAAFSAESKESKGKIETILMDYLPEIFKIVRLWMYYGDVPGFSTWTIRQTWDLLRCCHQYDVVVFRTVVHAWILECIKSKPLPVVQEFMSLATRDKIADDLLEAAYARFGSIRGVIKPRCHFPVGVGYKGNQKCCKHNLAEFDADYNKLTCGKQLCCAHVSDAVKETRKRSYDDFEAAFLATPQEGQKKILRLVAGAI